MSLIYLFCFLLCFVFNCQCDFQSYRREMEELVEGMALELKEPLDDDQQAYENCPDSCKQSHYDECVSISAEVCYDDFPKHNQCFGSGITMSGEPAFRLSPENVKDSLTCEQVAFMCKPQGIQGYLRGTVKDKRSSRYAKGYVGSITGIFYSHPASLSHCVTQYDPRTRPWFTAGSSGMRSLALFFKITKLKNLNHAQKLGHFILNSSNTDGWIRTAFLDKCSSQGDSSCGTLVKTTNRQKSILLEEIKEKLTTAQSWDEGNYQIMTNLSKNQFQERNTNRNILMIVTDAEPDVQQLKKILLNNTSARLVVVMINRTSSENLKNLACENGGMVLDYDTEDKNIITQMRPLIDYFSQGLDAAKPIWSDAYDDAFEFGRMVTVVMPVYNKYWKLLAVAGLDVTLTYLEQEYQMSQSEILEELSSTEEYTFQPDQCDFCSLTGCQQNFTEATISSNLSSQSEYWSTGEQKSGEVCCGLTNTEAYILIFIFVAFFFFLLTGCIIYRCCQSFKEKQQNRISFEKVHAFDNNSLPSFEPVKPKK